MKGMEVYNLVKRVMEDYYSGAVTEGEVEDLEVCVIWHLRAKTSTPRTDVVAIAKLLIDEGMVLWTSFGGSWTDYCGGLGDGVSVHLNFNREPNTLVVTVCD